MKLLTSFSAGSLALPNRVLMSPLTRVRADKQHVPGDRIAEHYRQRASAGLIIAEATMVAGDARAFGDEPGIYSPAHVEGWRKVTSVVHAAGGRIACQNAPGGGAVFIVYLPLAAARVPEAAQ